MFAYNLHVLFDSANKVMWPATNIAAPFVQNIGIKNEEKLTVQ